MRYRLECALISGLLWFGLGSLWAQTPSMLGTGLQWSVAVDTVLKTGDALDETSDLAQVRGAEIMAYAPIDPIFDGVLSIAAHPENGESVFEIHEAYIKSSKLIPLTRFRLGKFFLGIGRLNRFHQHDWPFVSAPKVHRMFFDKEGVLDSGAEASVLLPLPFYWDVTVGVTNGWTFGHSHDLGEKPKVPVHYIRSAHYLDLPRDGAMEWGLNYLGRKNAQSTAFDYFGLDGTAKWRSGGLLSLLIQSEVWSRTQRPSIGDSETWVGGYVYPQIALNQTWRFGIRGDFLTNTSLETVSGKRLSNGTWALVPTLSWAPSEFSRFSVAYTYEIYDPGAEDVQYRNALEFQYTFIIGAHPAHQF